MVKEHPLIGEYANRLKDGEKFTMPDRTVVNKAEDLYLPSIDFSKDFVPTNVSEEEPPKVNEKGK